MKRFLLFSPLLLLLLLLVGGGTLSVVAKADPPKGPPTFEKVVHVFYPVPKGAKPPWTGGGGGGKETCDFATTRNQWASGSLPVPFYVNPANSGGASDDHNANGIVDALEGILDADAAWNAVSKSTWATQYIGTTSRGASSLNGVMDGFNDWTWESISAQYPNAIAVTIVWRNIATGIIAEADAIMNSDLPWDQDVTVADPDAETADSAGAYDVQNIAAHEAGHWLMLDHVNLSDHTMYTFGSVGELQKRTLACGDEDGAVKMYGSGGGGKGNGKDKNK